jgi:hypothetical protein
LYTISFDIAVFLIYKDSTPLPFKPIIQMMQSFGGVAMSESEKSGLKKRQSKERGAVDEVEAITVIINNTPGLKARVLDRIRSVRGSDTTKGPEQK